MFVCGIKGNGMMLGVKQETSIVVCVWSDVRVSRKEEELSGAANVSTCSLFVCCLCCLSQ